MREELDKFVAELAELTDCNDHSGSLVALTNQFSYLERFREPALEIKQQHEDKGYLPYKLVLKREQLRGNCVATVRMIHGEDIADKINRAM